MIISDFEYNGIVLSSLGYLVVSFDGEAFSTRSNGAPINFKTTPILKGDKHILADTAYDECLTADIQIIKNPCLYEGSDAYLSIEEISSMMRWLNRRGFYPIRFDVDGYDNIFFEGTFNNVQRLEVGGHVVGLQMTLVTNRPYGTHKAIKKTFEMYANQPVVFQDISDEVGFIYPKTEIEILQSGNLILHNSVEDRETIIKGCVSGETINMEYPQITTSRTSHNIADSFNYNFFRIANSWENKINRITSSLQCNLTIEYHPIRKVGI